MKRRGMHFIPYDYESAFDKSIEDINEGFVEYLLKTKYRCVYSCKEIKAGQQLEVEIYPEFTKREDIPAEGRRVSKETQRNLNNKNAVKYCQRVILENFSNEDIWLTLTYEDGQEPRDMKEAIKNIVNYIRRINYKRGRLGLPNVKYLYVTEHNPEDKIRWHHHILIDGMMDRDLCEKTWKKGKRPQSRRLEEDKYGLVGMANYITKEKHRARNERRWNCSKGLRQFRVRKVRSKQKGGCGRYVQISKYVETFVRDRAAMEAELKAWYPDYDLLESNIYYNGVNNMFYITARMRTYGKGRRNAGSKHIRAGDS